MADSAKIKAVAERVFRERFGESVRLVTSSVDSDGEAIRGDEFIMIRYVFDTPSGLLDPKKTVGMIRHLRAPLHDELSEDRFPLVSYVFVKEAKTEAA